MSNILCFSYTCATSFNDIILYKYRLKFGTGKVDVLMDKL